MANKMDDLITAGLMQRDEFEEIMCKDMEAFIKKSGYTWTVQNIINHYREDYSKGNYVSHTCKIVILKFEDRLKKLYQ